MRYFGGMTGRMLAPVAVMWMMASVAGPSALAAGLTGDEVTVLITERLTAENLQAAPIISPNRIFPDCAGKVEILPMFGSWHTVNVACNSSSGWRFAIRANVSSATSARASDWRSGGSADSVSISRLVTGKDTTSKRDSATSVQVFALKRSVSKGDIITADDLLLVEVAGRNAIGMFKGDDDLVGRRLKSSLTAGKPVRTRHLEPDYMVVKDAEVIITSKAGVVNVDVVGIALEDGQFGEWIKVENASSGQSVFAKVISEKKVAVVAKKS
jgi:flagella basal body P-ring formation protein FlgA